MRKRSPMPRRLTSDIPPETWMTPAQCGPKTAPATTKKTTSGMGRPGMRLARNDDTTTAARTTASMMRSWVMGGPSEMGIATSQTRRRRLPHSYPDSDARISAPESYLQEPRQARAKRGGPAKGAAHVTTANRCRAPRRARRPRSPTPRPRRPRHPSPASRCGR